MDAAAVRGLELLLREIGLDPGGFGGSVTFAGEEPLTPSRHRVGAANGAAIAAMAVGVATLWKLRSGTPQDIRVDLQRAVAPGLMPLNVLSQNGHSLGWGATRRGANFFRTKDDRYYYVLHALDYPDHFLRMLDFLDCSDARDAIAASVAQWNAVELEDAMAERKLVGGVARTSAEWLAHPQGRWLAGQPAIAIEKIAEGAPMPLPPGERPLSGIRVIDMGHVLAGPTSARTLAEQGAEVLRISSPANPDPNIQLMDTGWGKRSAFLDLNRNDDVDTLRSLVVNADVFAQSWRPGTLARRGFSPESLAGVRSGLIYLSVSSYGDGGPWWNRGGYDPVGQTVCGIAFDEGAPDVPRLVPTFTLNDYVAAYMAAAGVIAALVRRSQEGGSYHVRVSLTRASMFVQELGLLPRPSDAAPKELPAPKPEHLLQNQTAWGMLEHAAPLAEYSQTPARWDVPVEPLGASLPRWYAHDDRL
jgi:crotonobetainyl-CoA:carnitine CoA-transferase CaiB-like acyl-CoA transferase